MSVNILFHYNSYACDKVLALRLTPVQEANEFTRVILHIPHYTRWETWSTDFVPPSAF
jgi:hypothetical protein